MKRRWLIAIPAAWIVLLAAALAVRLGRVDFRISFPVDLDVIILTIALALATFAAAGIIFKQGMERIRQLSVEQAREEAFAEHRRFLRRLDHELKNPLTAIRAGIVNLSETAQTEAQRQVLESMEAQTLRLSRLVTDLRKLAEMEMLPLEIEPVDVGELLEEVLSVAEERATGNERRLALRLPPPPLELPTWMGDRDLLLLAVHNVLDNAFKFTRPRDEIRIEASVDEHSLLITVSDTGIGIPREETSLVWEELYRGERSQIASGSGIGLALVQVIVKHMGGQVQLDSSIGQGTTVTLQLPLKVAPLPHNETHQRRTHA